MLIGRGTAGIWFLACQYSCAPSQRIDGNLWGSWLSADSDYVGTKSLFLDFLPEM